MKGAPWVKFFPSDFLTGIVELSAEEIGCYAVILALIWDKGQPIEDDAQWLARRCGISTRKWTQIVRPRLIQLGKIEIRDGLLGNRRALEEVQKRDQISDTRRAAAFARWNADEQPELDLSQDYLENISDLSQDNLDLISSKKQPKSQKTAKPPDAHASPTRARPRPRGQRLEESYHTVNPIRRARAEHDEGTDDVKLDDQSIDFLFGVICEAAAHFPPDEHVDTAKNFIRRWREAGLSFDDVVLPTIRRIIAKSPDPSTSSLGRFDKTMMGEAAKARAVAAEPPGKPPPQPQLAFEDEDPRFVEIRKVILKGLGPVRYVAIAHPIRFKVEKAVGEGEIAGVVDNGFTAVRFCDEVGRVALMRICKSHGFKDFW